MRTFLAALSLITILPLPGFECTEKDLKKASDFFPLAGLLLAIIAWGISSFFAFALPLHAAAVLAALLPEVFTKGFHLDGLADTADGFLSSRPRERILEIMHDSHIGSMGVLAIVSVLLFKYSLFVSLGKENLAIVSAWSVLAGRCGITFYIQMSRYARESGLGKILFEYRSLIGILWGLLLSGAFAEYFFGACYFPLLLFAFVLVWKRITDHMIGGATGDTIGACEELCEIAALLLCTVLP